MSITSNQLNGKTWVHLAANATLTIAGNNSVSNVATGAEILKGATIRQVIWGCGGGYWTVKRGANTALVLSQSGSVNFSEKGTLLNLDPTATLVFELTTGPGFIMVELQKQPNSVAVAIS